VTNAEQNLYGYHQILHKIIYMPICVQWRKIAIPMDLKHMTQHQECFLIYAQIVELNYYAATKDNDDSN